MNRLVRSFVIAAVASVLSCASAWAQATAGISGTVRDQSGGVLPGATITVTQADTGLAMLLLWFGVACAGRAIAFF